MPLVTVRGAAVPTVVLRPGETLLFGRAPEITPAPGRVALPLPDCAPHVSWRLGELAVEADTATLRWLGAGEAQLSSLFDAPGGARRVIMTRSMSAVLDDGENQLILLLGRQNPPAGRPTCCSPSRSSRPRPPRRTPRPHRTGRGPRLAKGSWDW